MAADLLPDVVLMDLRMPRCDGVEATRLLRQRVPQASVVVLTTYADDQSVLDALRQVLDHHAILDPAVQHHVVDALAVGRKPPARLPAGLTPREAEVL